MAALLPDSTLLILSSQLVGENPVFMLSSVEASNPVPDRLRVTSDTGQNLRINVDNGETIVDGDIAYAEEDDVGGIADIPLLGPLLGAIGGILLPEDQVPLTDTPVAISGDQGFDIIGGDNGLVLAALSSNGMGPYTLYSINLMTGAFTDRGQIGGENGPALRGIAIQLR